MLFHQNGPVRFLTFDAFNGAGITHGIFTRQGGESPEPWKSLNVGGGVGDEKERVIRNRHAVFNALGLPSDSVFDVWQVHSANVIFSEAPRPLNEPYQYADIIITDRPDVTLFMRFADCVPILLADPGRGIVGLAHAGWLGTVKNVAAVAAAAIQARFGSRPGDLIAAIGPSICVDHYQVGEEVVAQVKQTFGPDASRVLVKRGQAVHLDLWAANQMQLEKMGITRIETVCLCTAENTSDWFSHRAEKGKTGRFGALISMAGLPA
jgi:polyphenol oxidase